MIFNHKLFKGSSLIMGSKAGLLHCLLLSNMSSHSRSLREKKYRLFTGHRAGCRRTKGQL